MTKRDSSQHQKSDNGQLDKETVSDRISQADKGSGFLIYSECAADDPPEQRSAQEHHNAGHALLFLSMVVHALIHGTPSQIGREKTKRITGHLAYLREFLPDDNHRLRSLVTDLLHSVETASPETESEWLRFVYAHWSLIRPVAEHYGSHDKCFPTSSYEKISDLVNKRQWQRLWWWKIKMQKLRRVYKKTLKTIVKGETPK